MTPKFGAQRRATHVLEADSRPDDYPPYSNGSPQGPLPPRHPNIRNPAFNHRPLPQVNVELQLPPQTSTSNPRPQPRRRQIWIQTRTSVPPPPPPVFVHARMKTLPLAERIGTAERSEGAIVDNRVVRTNAGMVREFSYAPAQGGSGRGRSAGRGGRGGRDGARGGGRGAGRGRGGGTPRRGRGRG